MSDKLTTAQNPPPIFTEHMLIDSLEKMKKEKDRRPPTIGVPTASLIYFSRVTDPRLIVWNGGNFHGRWVRTRSGKVRPVGPRKVKELLRCLYDLSLRRSGR